MGYQALLNMLTKKSKGLQAMGVGGVSCARHQMFGPLGMGNLQKGTVCHCSKLLDGYTNDWLQVMQYGSPLDIVNQEVGSFDAYDIL